MENTRRKPSDKVFEDIKLSAQLVWMNGGYHHEYEKEKILEVQRITNFADNWNHIVGMFDSNNQILLCAALKYQESINFLKRMRKFYMFSMPREKQ